MPQCQYCHAINKANSDKCCRCGKQIEKDLDLDRLTQEINPLESKEAEHNEQREELSALVHFSAEIPEL